MIAHWGDRDYRIDLKQLRQLLRCGADICDFVDCPAPECCKDDPTYVQHRFQVFSENGDYIGYVPDELVATLRRRPEKVRL